MSINSEKCDNLPAAPKVGTKCYIWMSDDSKRKIVSVQLAPDSILQIKDMTNHVRNYFKKYYQTFDEWRSSLPEGGKIHTVHSKRDAQDWINWEHWDDC